MNKHRTCYYKVLFHVEIDSSKVHLADGRDSIGLPCLDIWSAEVSKNSGFMSILKPSSLGGM